MATGCGGVSPSLLPGPRRAACRMDSPRSQVTAAEGDCGPCARVVGRAAFAAGFECRGRAASAAERSEAARSDRELPTAPGPRHRRTSLLRSSRRDADLTAVPEDRLTAAV